MAYAIGGVGVLDGGTSSGSLAAAIATANAKGGGVIRLNKGTYNMTVAQTLTANNIQFMGNGPGFTFLQADDAGGLGGGDMITASSVLNATFEGITFSSVAQRTAGNFIKVLGVDAITANPAQRVRCLRMADCDMENGFKGVTLNNNAAVTAGCWGARIDRVVGLNFGANGIYIDVDSTLGGQTQISNCEFHGANGLADGSRASAGVRYRGGADIELENITAVYLQNGFLSDPTAGNVASVVLMNKCDWDNMSRDAVKIGGNGGTSNKVVILAGWHQTVLTAGGINLANVNNATLLGNTCWSNSVGIVLNGVVRAAVSDNDCSSSIIGIQATGVTTDFSLIGNLVGIAPGGSTPTTGITIGASCDHLNVDGNILRQCTTPITNAATPSANRVVIGAGNITS
jgi:hypothetical protein